MYSSWHGLFIHFCSFNYMNERHPGEFIIFSTGEMISLAENKLYYRAQRWVIGRNDLEIILKSHWIGFLIPPAYNWGLMLWGNLQSGRGGSKGRREHCSLPPGSWCHSHFPLLPTLNDGSLKELPTQCKESGIHSLLTLDSGSRATPEILLCSCL